MNKRAFTLLETLIVILIISILSYIVLPNFNFIKRLKVENELQTIINDIEHYRNLAVLDGYEYIFRVENSGGNYSYKISKKDGTKRDIVREYEFDNSIVNSVHIDLGRYSQLSFKKEATPSVAGSIRLKTIDGLYKITISPGVIKPNLRKE